MAVYKPNSPACNARGTERTVEVDFVSVEQGLLFLSTVKFQLFDDRLQSEFSPYKTLCRSKIMFLNAYLRQVPRYRHSGANVIFEKFKALWHLMEAATEGGVMCCQHLGLEHKNIFPYFSMF